MLKFIKQWMARCEKHRKVRSTAKLTRRIACHRDKDFTALKLHCAEVQKDRDTFRKSLAATSKGRDASEVQLRECRSTASRLDLYNADLKIDIENLTHERDKLRNQLDIANLSLRQMAEIIERDRERVIAEKHVYTALGEKAGN